MILKTESNGSPYLEVKQTDYALITHPLLNKGMGFTEEERDSFKLHGLLPPYVATIDEQRARSYAAFQSKTSNLEKYIYLLDLQNSNETLFYNLITHHIEEMMPIIYTPTVGEGCKNFGKIYRRPRGIFLSYPNKQEIENILSNPRFNSVEVIVVSDGERILGLGDQGACGMGIPIGKLALYTACAGIHPKSTLPIILDTGTDNEDLLNDPSYIGWRHKRVRGKDYDEFIDQFVSCIKKRFPKVLLQWEDFAKQNADRILNRYRDSLLTFNDDIQGTAAVATSALLAAIAISKVPLTEQKIVIVGGGSAGCGIAKLLLQAMQEEGLSEEEGLTHFFTLDKEGLLLDDAENLMPFQKPFAKQKKQLGDWANYFLEETIKQVKPTLLIGVSGKAGLFTENVIREISLHVERPIIFPLSNPTCCSEGIPSEILKWSGGRAIIGTGSPFPDVIKEGKPFRIDQTNNAYIFPGLGLGAIAASATTITDQMILVAAKTLAKFSPAKTNPEANLLPPLEKIRELSKAIALAVAEEAIASQNAPFLEKKELLKKIDQKIWTPVYIPYKKPINP